MLRDDAEGRQSFESVRIDLAKRLRERRSEIEEGIIEHAQALANPPGDQDADYLAGLRLAVKAVLDYALTGIERGDEWFEPIPPAAMTQAYRAARNGVCLDIVLRRYVAGNRLLGSFVISESDHFPVRALRQVLDLQGSLLERLIVTISSEYRRESIRAGRSREDQRSERIRDLLAGEARDITEFGYRFDAWHLGIIATGSRTLDVLRSLAARSNCQLLTTSHTEGTTWAWLGGKRRLVTSEIDHLLAATDVSDVRLAIGEPCEGMDGWRLTHGQAKAALQVAQHRPQTVTRYIDEMLLAAALRDEILAKSLVQIYLAPLSNMRDSGWASRETLRAYFGAGRNASAAGAQVGIARQTVEQRLRSIEQRLGRALSASLKELEVALRFDGLTRPTTTDGRRPAPDG